MLVTMELLLEFELGSRVTGFVTPVAELNNQIA